MSSRHKAGIDESAISDYCHLDGDYQREIAPWLGEEITLAMTAPDLDRNLRNGAESGYLAILSSRDGKVSASKYNGDRQKRPSTLAWTID
jgi:hypothetical protein